MKVSPCRSNDFTLGAIEYLRQLVNDWQKVLVLIEHERVNTHLALSLLVNGRHQQRRFLRTGFRHLVSHSLSSRQHNDC